MPPPLVAGDCKWPDFPGGHGCKVAHGPGFACSPPRGGAGHRSKSESGLRRIGEILSPSVKIWPRCARSWEFGQYGAMFTNLGAIMTDFGRTRPISGEIDRTRSTNFGSILTNLARNRPILVGVRSIFGEIEQIWDNFSQFRARSSNFEVMSGNLGVMSAARFRPSLAQSSTECGHFRQICLDLAMCRTQSFAAENFSWRRPKGRKCG